MKKLKKLSVSKANEQPASPIDALVRKLDLVAHDAEIAWGQGVLYGLCNPETAAKFMRVKAALDEAIQGGDYDTVKQKSESLIRGWQAMENEAIQAGHEKGHITNICYVASPNGIEYILCKNDLDASRAMVQHPDKASAIFTFAQIAEMLENGSLKVFMEPDKENLKKVIGFSKPVLNDIDKVLNDKIPF